MQYRRLGSSGLQLSALSFGAWLTFGAQIGRSTARDLIAAAWDNGVNFFDNAEIYAKGQSETIMGDVLAKSGWRRASYIVSTKFFWGLNDGPNEKNTLNRKYLMQAIDGSLARLKLDYVDLVYCHRPDPDTPLEETVRAMSDIIDPKSGEAIVKAGRRITRAAVKKVKSLNLTEIEISRDDLDGKVIAMPVIDEQVEKLASFADAMATMG